MLAIHRDGLVYHIQKHVGYAGAVACALLTLVNLIGGLVRESEPVWKVLINPAVSVVAGFAVIAYLTTLRDWRWLRLIQVSVFLAYSYIASIFIDPGSLHGALFGIYGLVLSMQYGLLQRRFWAKIALLALSYAAIRFARAADANVFLFHAAPAVAILVGLFAYLFWVAFAEEITAYTSENRHLKVERDKNKVFVEFGQNISGVVHNLKSTLMSIDGCIDVLRTVDARDRDELLDIQKSSTDKMLQMINNFMFAVRSYQKTDISVLSLNKLVESSVEVLKGNRTLKHKLKIETNLEDPDTILGSPMDIMQVIDNVVTNAAEAMFGTDRYILHLETRKIDGFIRFSVIDQGVGIERCSRCTEFNCLRCSQFGYGKTTKVDGVGIGMMYVRKVLEEMNGHMRVESRTGIGTTVHLSFPYLVDENHADVG